MTLALSRTSLSARRATRALLLTLAAAAGCSGGDAQPTGSLVDGSLSVSPRNASIYVRESVQLSAATHVADATVQWRSLTADVADVSASGLVTATDRAGVARIVATSNGGSDTATVTVKERATRVTQVAVAGPVAGAQVLAVGVTSQLSVTVRDETGQTVTDRPIIWASANSAVATVSTTGALFAVAPGSTSITATAEGVSGAVAVTVTASAIATLTVQLSAPSLRVGQTGQATAVALDPQGQPVTGRPVAWTSSNTAVLAVSANGALQAVSVGSASITATVDGVTASATVSVATAVARVTVAPATMTLKPGDLERFSATAYDVSGQQIAGQSAVWSSGNTAVATIDASGQVTARTVGSAVMSATIDGIVGTGTVVVNSTGGNTTVPVATVSVSLGASTVQVGQSTQATASAFDASGNALTGRAVAWASSNPAVATVGANGAVIAVSAGSVTITATSEGRSGSATLTVQTIPPVTVATVGVALGASAVNVGATTQATAVARDAGGNALTGRAVTWSSSNAAVATVSGAGVVTGVAAGTASIRATVDGIVGNATVTVNAVAPAAVATLTVSPNSINVFQGNSGTLVATTRDANGNTLTGRTITWTSSNPAALTVNSSGVFTGVLPGLYQITATSEGVTGTASVVVNQSTGGTDGVSLLSTSFDNVSTVSDVRGLGYLITGTVQVVPGRTGNAVRFPYSPTSTNNMIEYWFGGVTNPTPITDINVSYWFRTSPGADPTCGGANASGFKWFMLWRPSGHARYTQGVGNLNAAGNAQSNAGLEFTSHDNSSTRQPNPFLQNVTKSVRFGTTNDGQWHRYSLHVVTGSAGYEQIWIDGVKILDNQGMGYDHDATGITMVQWPGTMVSMSAGCDFYVDIDDVTITGR